MPRFLAHVPRRFFLAVMLVGSALITASSLAYFDFETLPPFVIEKLPVRFESLWLASLRIHVASASLVFLLCLLLMTRWLQRRPTWHRWLGRFTGASVLFALVPSGVVLALDAKGGNVVTAGFLLSAAIVAWCMVGGILAARRRDLVPHRRAMRHVAGQMSVAVTSRALRSTRAGRYSLCETVPPESRAGPPRPAPTHSVGHTVPGAGTVRSRR